MRKGDNLRLVMFLVASAVVMFGWYLIFPPKPPQRPKPPAPVVPPPPDPGPGFWATVSRAALEALTTYRQADVPVQDDITLSSDRVRMTLTNRGAAVLTLEALYPDPTKPVSLLTVTDGAGHFALRGTEETADPLDTAPWSFERPDDATVEFHYQMRDGLRILKRYRLVPEKYAFRIEFELANRRSGHPITPKLEWRAVRGMHHDSDYRVEQYMSGAYVAVKGNPEYVAVSQVEKEVVEKKGDERHWYGVKNRYFAVALVPDDASREWPRAALFSKLSAEQKKALVSDFGMNLTLPVSATPVGGEVQRAAFTVYAGPLRPADLDAVHKELAKLGGVATCGCFSWIVNLIAPVLLMLMNGVHAVVGNYGVAIILTTIVVRLCLFPLSRKSQIEMAKFAEVQKKIKPRLELIQQRYSDNPQKLRAEQMKLFQEHGASMLPLGGCLPMLLQIPIFISMYAVFDQSIDLRLQPFFGWMGDLSQPDHALRIGGHFNLWNFLRYDGYLNVLPILMTVTWTLQSMLAPRPAATDPQMEMQYKMMRYMPVFFGVMCYTLASGLSLYFLVNSLLGMAEQRIIKKLWIPQPAAPEGGAVKAP